METSMVQLKDQFMAVRTASQMIRNLHDAAKQALLQSLATLIEERQEAILAANALDLARMEDANPKKDRLLLTPVRLQGLAASVRAVAQLTDPTGIVSLERTLENGLALQKMQVPLGVVGVIYEARPNVTIDVASLCLRSGNGVVLRGGSEAKHSNRALVGLIHEALQAQGLPTAAVLLMPVDRALVPVMLKAEREIDIIIPRGSQALIDFVRKEATVPTIETGAGVCHTYVHAAADLGKARDIVLNAKISRPSVCNALDTVVVDAQVAAAFLPMLVEGFSEAGVAVWADPMAYGILKDAGLKVLHQAEAEDFGREFLSLGCSVKVVNGLEEALGHVQQYSSRHSEAIVSEDLAVSERFLKEVDAAAVYANASTRFTDGGVFGLGAEIGISTQKLHARGPFALEKLTTEKWILRGQGQIR